MAKHTKNSGLIQQPKFDNRIYRLTYPLQPAKDGILKRGNMVWAQPITGVGGLATVHFLYNPTTVEADYALSDASVGATLLFPIPGDKANLRVPLQQTVTWSILYDRTYEVWDGYHTNGTPKHGLGPHGNNPQVVGVGADIIQMQQFTGMTVGYGSRAVPGAAGGTTITKNPGGASANFTGHQGILQLIPSYVFFGDKNNLGFYGYISEWSFQITHWSQFMVPTRCVINITFTMLPSAKNQSGANAKAQPFWGAGQKTAQSVAPGLGSPSGQGLGR